MIDPEENHIEIVKLVSLHSLIPLERIQPIANPVSNFEVLRKERREWHLGCLRGGRSERGWNGS